MKLELTRELGTEGYTFGALSVNGTYECHTLEDQVRDKKIHGETAIPAGTYEVIVSFSPRFQRDLPLLVSVPNFEGVRIHPGNTAADTEGCILPGRTRDIENHTVGASRVAFNSLYEKILDAWKRHESIQITVS